MRSRANLLLAQSPDQKQNQDHLETYLSGTPDLAATSLGSSKPGRDLAGYEESELRSLRRSDTLQNLEVQLEIIELFALHILPRNEEWRYAKDFLQRNELLDEERRDSLIQAVDDLEKENYGDGESSAEEAYSTNDASLPSVPPFTRMIDRNDSNVTIIPASSTRPRNSQPEQQKNLESQDLPIPEYLRSISPRPDRASPEPEGLGQDTGKRVKAPEKKGQANVLQRTFALYNMVSSIVSNTTANLMRNPAPLLRFVLFLMVFLGALARTDLRERLRRAIRRSLESVRHTIGMGFKASYI